MMELRRLLKGISMIRYDQIKCHMRWRIISKVFSVIRISSFQQILIQPAPERLLGKILYLYAHLQSLDI